MNDRDAVLLAEIECRLWKTFSRSLLRPDLGLAEDIKSGGYSRLLRSLLRTGEHNYEALEKVEALEGSKARTALPRLLCELEVDYNRLFVGPGPLLAPPYESFYESTAADGQRGRLRTQAERRVSAKYKEHGFAMPDTFIELPDHIAIELEFLAILSKKESEAWKSEDARKALGLQQEREFFLKEHVGKWFVACTQLIVSHSSKEFSPVSTAARFYAPVATLICSTLDALQ